MKSKWIAIGITVICFTAILIGAAELIYQSRMREVEAIITESRLEEQRQSEAMMKQEELAKKACPEAAVILPNRFICVPYINSAK